MGRLDFQIHHKNSMVGEVESNKVWSCFNNNKALVPNGLKKGEKYVATRNAILNDISAYSETWYEGTWHILLDR